jgi:hypothetical protein
MSGCLWCMLNAIHDFLMAGLQEQCICVEFCFILGGVGEASQKHTKCSKELSVTMAWGEHRLLIGFLDLGMGNLRLKLWELRSSLHKSLRWKFGTLSLKCQKLHKYNNIRVLIITFSPTCFGVYFAICREKFCVLRTIVTFCNHKMA